MIFRTGNRPTNALQPVAIEAAIRHQTAIRNASHLLSCTDYLLQALPEDFQELPVMGDLTVLLEKVAEEIKAARVRFQPVEITPQQDEEAARPAPVAAPWRNQPPRPVAPQEEGFETFTVYRRSEDEAPHGDEAPREITFEGVKYVPQAA